VIRRVVKESEMKESLPQVARRLLGAVRTCYDVLPAIREDVWPFEDSVLVAIASLLESLTGVFTECSRVSDPYYDFGPEPGVSDDAFAVIDKFMAECEGFLARCEDDSAAGCPFPMMEFRGQTLMSLAFDTIEKRKQADR
jgi:hypothetical protein